VTCATVDAGCLRALPTAVVANQLAVAFNTASASPVPAVDGKVLTRSIKETFAAGDNTRVPIMNGSNKDEYSLFIAIGELGRRAAAMPPSFDPANTSFSLQTAAYAPTLAGLAAGTGLTGATLASAGYYPLADFGANAALQPSLGATSMGTDVVFACQGLNISKRAQAQGSAVWSYEFRDQTALPSVGNDATGKYYLSFSQGAAHSYELQYLFNLRDLQNDERRALQDSMTRYWTNFARSGDPNQGIAPAVTWPAFTGADKVLGLDVASGGGIKLLDAPFETAHKCPTVWTSLTF
jgi:para-nitrobenzyl esterase